MKPPLSRPPTTTQVYENLATDGVLVNHGPEFHDIGTPPAGRSAPASAMFYPAPEQSPAYASAFQAGAARGPLAAMTPRPSLPVAMWGPRPLCFPPGAVPPP